MKRIKKRFKKGKHMAQNSSSYDEKYILSQALKANNLRNEKENQDIWDLNYIKIFKNPTLEKKRCIIS
jgi:hypothetical protein